MKAMLYGEVLNNSPKADQLMKQLKSDFQGTAFVTGLQQAEEKQKAAQKIHQSLVAGAVFPGFNEKDLTGKPLVLADYKGKIVLIDFWATWCGPCRGEIPNVVAAYQKYHGQGFEIIGVSLDQDRQKLLDYTKQMNMTWPQFFDGQGWANKLAAQYGIESIPATFLLDGNGKIIGQTFAVTPCNRPWPKPSPKNKTLSGGLTSTFRPASAPWRRPRSGSRARWDAASPA